MRGVNARLFGRFLIALEAELGPNDLRAEQVNKMIALAGEIEQLYVSLSDPPRPTDDPALVALQEQQARRAAKSRRRQRRMDQEILPHNDE